MDRLAELAKELTTLLQQLNEEAQRQDLDQLVAPLAWLDESNSWFNYELRHCRNPEPDPVPFTYIPADLRK